jgi:pimeloyl-ACP methyl ester carboxylesterase
MFAIRLSILWCGLAILIAGCEGIAVHRRGAPDLLEDWHNSFVAKELSPRALQTLHQLDLEELYHRSPADAYARLQGLAEQQPQGDILFALSEMSYLLGRQAEKAHLPTVLAYYYFCAGYAYHYLFPQPVTGLVNNPDPTTQIVRTALSPLPVEEATVNPFDPRFRLACDLYNAGLAKCIQAAQRVGQLDARQQLRLPGPNGQAFTLSVVHHGFNWPGEEFGLLHRCADFEVEGLDSMEHGYGLGVPLIGTHRGTLPAPAHAFYLKNMNFPVTAFFRFDGSVADLASQRAGRLELYNPLAQRTVEVNGRTVPLETDLTTPLAYFLSYTELDGIQYKAFLRADNIHDRAGIYLFEPYQPGKIPVVLVHGLLSTPVVWTPLFNELLADPEICRRYQFWFYLYPTSEPYLVTAADLRQSLNELRAELDPQHKDAALDQMVLCGHSMGGLISRLLTVDSGDAFWRLVSSEPFERLKAKPETRAQLQRIFFFERQPYVRRVVFMATPHHGSAWSRWPLVRLGTQLVRQPRRLLNTADELAQANPQAWPTMRQSLLPTSVDLLAPSAPALEALAARPRPEGVHYHSILGVKPQPWWEKILLVGASQDEAEGDSVVPYSSAHLEGVDSERAVPAYHWQVPHHPQTVQEVRRILLEHLRTVTTE